MAITITFDEEEISRDYTNVATGGPVYDTAVIGNTLGTQQRAIRRQDAIRTWEIQYEGLSRTQKLALETFFITKYGGGIGFRFLPPTDNQFQGDIIGTGNASTRFWPLYRVYSCSHRTIQRRIVKPVISTNIPVGWPLLTVRVDGNPRGFNLDAVNGILDINPPVYSGGVITVHGGAFTVPVMFESDAFDAADSGVVSEWGGVRLTEILPSALGIA